MTRPLSRLVERVRRSGTIVWLTGCGVYFLAVLHRSSLGVAGPEAIDRLHINAAQLGSFLMLQLGLYAAMQVPAGLLIDRFGPRRVLLGATLVMGAAQLLFAIATSYALALVARALLGIGDAAVYISVLRLAAAWFPRRRYAVLTMLAGLFGMAGNLAATLPLTLALSRFGWVHTFAVTALVSLAYALLLLRPAVAAPFREQTLHPRPSPARPPATADDDAAGPAPSSSRMRAAALDVIATWRGGADGNGTQLGFWTHQATMAGGLVFSMVWGYPYLTEGLGYEAADAAAELMIFVIATVGFSFLIPPYAGRRPGARMPLAIGVSFALLVAWAVLLAWPGGVPPRGVVTGALVVIAAGGPTSQIGFHLARDYTPQRMLGTATGLANMGGFLGAMIGAIAVGVVLDAVSGGAAPTLTDYRWALASLAVITAISTVSMVWCLLRLRRHLLARMHRGHDVVVPVVGHWWDGARAQEVLEREDATRRARE